MSTTMTNRLDDDVKATHRSKSFVDANEWQIKEIRLALGEADAGDFASEEDVQALAAKWRGLG